MRPRPKGPEAEAEAKILASRPVWPRGFNISGYRRLNRDSEFLRHSVEILKSNTNSKDSAPMRRRNALYVLVVEDDVRTPDLIHRYANGIDAAVVRWIPSQ